MVCELRRRHQQQFGRLKLRGIDDRHDRRFADANVLSSSKNPSTVGQQVTYTETIAPAPDAGNVSFTDHGRTISGCAAVSVGLTGQATCRQTYSAAGSQTIRASYSGSSRFAASQSAPLAQLIRRAVSALSVIGRSTSNRAGVTEKLRCAPSSLAPCRATVTLTTPKATQRGRSARGATASATAGRSSSPRRP